MQVPGKPAVREVKTDSVELLWQKPVKQAEQFQVRFKTEKVNAKWKFVETYVEENFIVVKGLMAHTKYIFQVRGVFGDQEGPYGPHSDAIETQKSAGTTLLELCQRLDHNSPSKYMLPIKENKGARSKQARTRQLYLGRIDNFQIISDFLLIDFNAKENMYIGNTMGIFLSPILDLMDTLCFCYAYYFELFLYPRCKPGARFPKELVFSLVS